MGWVVGGLGRRRDLRDKIRAGVAGRAGPGKRSGGWSWEATHPRAWLQSCFLPGLSCPEEKKTRKKRNVNFQKAIFEKCELWVPMKLSTWAQGSGGGVYLLAPLLLRKPVYGIWGQRSEIWVDGGYAGGSLHWSLLSSCSLRVSPYISRGQGGR